jgi:hypothetical protein
MSFVLKLTIVKNANIMRSFNAKIWDQGGLFVFCLRKLYKLKPRMYNPVCWDFQQFYIYSIQCYKPASGLKVMSHEILNFFLFRKTK